MAFINKLANFIFISAIYSFLKYLCYRQTKTRSCNV